MFDWIEEIGSAMKGHRVFLEWLVEYRKPNVVVELGVDYGYCTYVFSEAIKRLNVDGKVYGIDWFEGDTSTGFRNTKEEVEKNIKRT